MKNDEQFEPLFRVLSRFKEEGVLSELMLIGSWCLFFYRRIFRKSEDLPALRTLDVDFLIPNTRTNKKETDIPKILKQEGFVSTFNRSNDAVKYDHPELQLEFLVPEVGRGTSKAVNVKQFNVKAEALRYLPLLLDYPRIVSFQGLKVRVPEPSVFAVHKLLISSKRKKKEKEISDLETATGLLDFLHERPKEVKKIIEVLNKMPKKWRVATLAVAKKHYVQLIETYEKQI